MTTRKPLRSDLVNAWHKTITERYHTQQIDSERALQVHFCAALFREFASAERTRRVFIEPTIKFDGTQQVRKPDILVCNQNRIIGIVELKYKPQARASYTKDLETLALMAVNHENISVTNGRHRGPKKSIKGYALAPDAILCWAAVYSGNRISSADFLQAKSSRTFLALHAITSLTANPTIHP